MASNERIITFGLGDTTAVDSIDVHWPSGGHTIIETPPVDRFYLVTEGATSSTIHHLDGCQSFAVQVFPAEQASR